MSKRGNPLFASFAKPTQKSKGRHCLQTVTAKKGYQHMETSNEILTQNGSSSKSLSFPPPNNMGGENTFSTNPPPQTILIDYVRFTLPYTRDSFDSLSRYLVGEGERLDTGLNGYSERSSVLGSGFVLWHPNRPDMGVHCVLPAKALAQIDLTPIGLMNWVLDKGGKFTRIDVAYDDFSGLLDIAEIDRKLRKGEVVTRWKKAKTQTGSYAIGTGMDDGSGVTIGSRVSEAYCRIYDKKMERERLKIDVPVKSWVRCEIELKGEKSNELAKILGGSVFDNNASELLANFLYGMLDFKDPGKDTNKSRWETSGWWLKFVQATGKLKVSLPKDERTIDDVKEWWLSSVAPMTAVILLAHVQDNEMDGYNWLMTAITNGETRLKAKHKKLIQGTLPIKEEG